MAFYECKECGVVNQNPGDYVMNLRNKGMISCCPERRMILISESDDKSVLTDYQLERLKTGLEK